MANGPISRVIRLFQRKEHTPMLLFAGLGNPGEKYADNRHNIGFMAVDEIVRRHNFSPWKSKFQGLVSEGTLGSHKVLILKPMTHMNRSGQALSEAARFYKIPIEDIVVFHDEIDFAPAKMKVKKGGGAAGNNGIRSAISHIGPDFRRVRLGVGHPGNKGEVHQHVLNDFSKADRQWLEPLIDAMAEEAGWLAEGDDVRFMTAVALRLNPDTRFAAPDDTAPPKNKNRD